MRVSLAFVVLTAFTSGVLAITSYVIIDHHRTRNFAQRAQREVSLLALSSAQPTVEKFNETIDRWRRHADFDAVVIDADGELSSTPSIGTSDLPESLRDASATSPEVRRDTAVIEGQSYLVVADASVSDEITYYFLYSRRELLSGLAEFRNVLLIGWLASLAAAAAFGNVVARRTLRPVGRAAAAAAEVADGNLATRLDVRSDDEFGHLAATFNSMTQALDVKIHELSEAAERERRFTAAVAHDLRTPLTVMLSASALLRDDIAVLQPERSRRPLQLLLDDADRLSKLVQELLELARIDAGQLDLEPEEYPLRPVVSGVLGEWRRGHDGPSATIDVDEDLLAYGDAGCTTRILANLVDNAAKHGGGVTSITARRVGPAIRVDVDDDGPGVAPEMFDRLFDRFSKADSSRSSAGSGLGLALARHYAEVQQGTLVATNRPSGGARFTLTVPAGDVRARARIGASNEEAHR